MLNFPSFFTFLYKRSTSLGNQLRSTITYRLSDSLIVHRFIPSHLVVRPGLAVHEQVCLIQFVLIFDRLTITTIDLEIDNLDRVSVPTKVVATFDVEHPVHGTTYGPK